MKHQKKAHALVGYALSGREDGKLVRLNGFAGRTGGVRTLFYARGGATRRIAAYS